MESFTTHGFTMVFDNNNEKYLELKYAIEKLCQKSKNLSILYNRDPLIHFLAISKGTYITCFVNNKEVEFGIYKRNTNELLQNISSNSFIEINISAIYELENRMERIAKYPTHMNPEPLYSLWIEKIKEKHINKNQDNNIER